MYIVRAIKSNNTIYEINNNDLKLLKENKINLPQITSIGTKFKPPCTRKYQFIIELISLSEQQTPKIIFKNYFKNILENYKDV